MNRIKERRAELGLSQPDVVKLLSELGIKTDVSMLSRFENEICLPTAAVKDALDFILETPELAEDVLSDRKPNVSGTRLYIIWQGMKQRCYDASCNCYPRYGGRGVTICEEWRNGSEAFQAWALSHGYREDLTIDRIDVNGNYEPGNCRWATWKEQANNTRRNRYITYNEVTHTLTEWADIFGINYGTLRSRLDNGWSVERALTYRAENALQAPASELFDAVDLTTIGELDALPTTDEYSDSVKALLIHLGRGRDNAISRTHLCLEMGLPDRTVRGIIERARREGCIIINAQDGAGYYLSDDPDEWEAQYRQDTSRALSILSRRKALRARLKSAGREV